MSKRKNEDQPIMVLEGNGGVIELWPAKVTIRHKGVLSKMTVGLAGEKDVYLTGITGIQLKRPTWISKGYFQVQYMGSQDSKGGILNATKDENTVLFAGRKKYKQAQALKGEIEKRAFEMRAVPQAQAGPGGSSSVADELTKLADLKAQGIISSKEFEAQKKALLG